MTIKKRIFIWYTIWMGIMGILLLVAIFSGTGYLMRREALGELAEEVHEAFEEIRIEDGEIRIRDLDPYDDGIFIQIFDPAGELVFGRDEDDFPSISFNIGTTRTVGNWYVYEDESSGYVIRGLMHSSNTATYMGSLQLFAIILFPILLALAALGGYGIVRRSFRPADRAIEAAEHIVDSNDLSKRIGLGPGSDEIHQVASAFDRMLDRLEAAFIKEKQFTSDASHELRTPLSVIKAECEYTLGHKDDCIRLSEALENIDRQADRMNALVGELLSLARSDKGTLKPSIESFDLGELACMVAESLADRAEEKGITITCKSSSLTVEADQGMITRVLINYISNAIQYGKNGGWVLVKVLSQGNDAVISVEDNGIGIDAGEIGKIWDRFYQADSARTAGSGSGAGLGLPIVKSIAEAHHGRVGAQSMPGQGSTFTFTFPVKQP